MTYMTYMTYIQLAEGSERVPARMLVRTWRTSDAISTRRPSPQAGWLADKESRMGVSHSDVVTL